MRSQMQSQRPKSQRQPQHLQQRPSLLHRRLLLPKHLLHLQLQPLPLLLHRLQQLLPLPLRRLRLPQRLAPQHRPLAQQLQRPLLQAQPQAFLVRATTRSRLARAWAFLVRWLVRATTRLHLRRAWVVLARVAQAAQAVLVRLVPVVLVALVVLVRLVPAVAHHARASVAARLVQVSVAAQALVAVPALAHLVRAALLQVVVAAVVAPLVHSARAVLVEHRRPASRSVQSGKSLSRDQHLALVAQLFHAAMAPRCFAYVVALASRTSQTRSMQTQVS